LLLLIRGVIKLRDVRVVIITGCEMYELSNNVYDIDVLPGVSHQKVLQEFMRKNDLVCYNDDFWVFPEQMQLAAMGNIVLIVSSFVMAVYFPVDFTPFQKEYIEEHRNEIVNEEKLVGILNLYEENDKIKYNEYNSSIIRSSFDDLVDSKIRKVKAK